MGVAEFPVAERVRLLDLVAYQDGAVVSRTLLKQATGTVTMFAFDDRQGLSEHTAPFDALVYVLEGDADVIIAVAPGVRRPGREYVKAYVEFIHLRRTALRGVHRVRSWSLRRDRAGCSHSLRDHDARCTDARYLDVSGREVSSRPVIAAPGPSIGCHLTARDYRAAAYRRRGPRQPHERTPVTSSRRADEQERCCETDIL